MVSRIASTASGADAAISTANACAAARSSSAGDEPIGEPDARALPRRARRRPVYMSSSARCWPTTAGSVTEMPKPWWNPSRAKLQLKRVSGVATRKSADEREAEPAADGRALHRGDDRLAVREDARRLRGRGGAVLSRRSLPLRSAPAQKFLPSEQSTIGAALGLVVEAQHGVGEQR